jgi:hypothetical protein
VRLGGVRAYAEIHHPNAQFLCVADDPVDAGEHVGRPAAAQGVDDTDVEQAGVGGHAGRVGGLEVAAAGGHCGNVGAVAVGVWG